MSHLGLLPRISVGVAAVGAVATMAVTVPVTASWDGTPVDLSMLLVLLGLGATGYLGMAGLAWWRRHTSVQRWIALLAAVPTTLWGVAAVVDAFLVRPSVFAGLVVWSVAWVQWTGVLIGLGLCLADGGLRRLKRSRASKGLGRTGETERGSRR